MIDNDRRVRIICGHYGCGKTEIAVNYALKLAETGKNPVLADIDVINPYFRSRERSEFLEKSGVKVIASSINASAIDVPAISAGVYSVFDDKTRDAVLDVGGDHAGINVLKRFSDHYSSSDEYDLFFVLNANRPGTSGADEVLKYIQSFQDTSGLSVTGLINNTHMLKSTAADDIIRGYLLAEKVSSESGIPVRYNTGLAELKDSLPDDVKKIFFPLKLYMRDDWMS